MGVGRHLVIAAELAWLKLGKGVEEAIDASRSMASLFPGNATLIVLDTITLRFVRPFTAFNAASFDWLRAANLHPAFPTTRGSIAVVSEWSTAILARFRRMFSGPFPPIEIAIRTEVSNLAFRIAALRTRILVVPFSHFRLPPGPSVTHCPGSW